MLLMMNKTDFFSFTFNLCKFCIRMFQSWMLKARGRAANWLNTSYRCLDNIQAGLFCQWTVGKIGLPILWNFTSFLILGREEVRSVIPHFYELWITVTWSTVPFKKITVSQLVTKFPTFYATGNFTTASLLSISWFRWD
jgi:hypothetical protein